jgi:phospholipid/cholesterol/gamma-HCH transport system substrate-binding protein
MKNTLETRLGMFTAVIVLAAVLILETLGSFDSFKKGRFVHAYFATAQELKAGDRVKLAGVEVGRVERVDIIDSQVRVTMKLLADAQVRTNSVAVIRFAGLLGQNFVALNFGTPEAPLIADGGILPSEEQADLNALMAKLDAAAGGIEQLTKNFSAESILGPVNDLVKQNGPNLTATITNLRTISTALAEGRGTLGKLVMDDTLYTSALNTVTNLQGTATDLRSVIADAKAGKGTVGKLLTDDKLYNDATGSMSNLKEILEKVNRGEGTAGKLVNDPEFYRNAKLTLQKLDKATDSIEDQGPLSVMGSFISTFY